MTARFMAATVAALMVLSGTAMAQTGAAPKKDKEKKSVPMKLIEPVKEQDGEKKDGQAGAVLKVGSAAPKLSVEKWMKGDQVKGLEAGKVYMVEFWATWCPPCLDSIPHLTELQKSHKELVVIGMASSEKLEKDGSDKREHGLGVAGVDGVTGGDVGDPGVAGSDDQPVAFWILQNRPGQRVFASARAENEYVHRLRPPLA